MKRTQCIGAMVRRSCRIRPREFGDWAEAGGGKVWGGVIREGRAGRGLIWEWARGCRGGGGGCGWEELAGELPGRELEKGRRARIGLLGAEKWHIYDHLRLAGHLIWRKRFIIPGCIRPEWALIDECIRGSGPRACAEWGF